MGNKATKKHPELMNLYMLIGKAYEDGIFSMDGVYEGYHIVDEAGLYGFVGTFSECVDAMNTAVELHRIKSGMTPEPETTLVVDEDLHVKVSD